MIVVAGEILPHGRIRIQRSLVEIVALMGCTGFGGAIGVHFAVGYLDFFHLMPAVVGFFIFILADGLLWIGWRWGAKAVKEPGGSGSHRTL